MDLCSNQEARVQGLIWDYGYMYISSIAFQNKVAMWCSVVHSLAPARLQLEKKDLEHPSPIDLGAPKDFVNLRK